MIRDQETLTLLLGSLSRFVSERLVPAENDVAETDEIARDMMRDAER
jgi:acyl-CoA dehydrogenase